MKSKFARAGRRWHTLLVSSVVVLLVSACVRSGPSVVSQGQRYTAGAPEFDRFFAELHGLKVQLDGAPARQRSTRAALARELEQQERSTTSQLARTVRRRASELAREGTELRVELEDDDAATARAEVIVSGRKPGARSESFLKALSAAAQAELELALNMAAARRKLAELRYTAIQLDKRVDTAFRRAGPRKKAEVRANLEDADALITILLVRAEEAEESADKVLRKLVDAAQAEGGRATAVVRHDASPEPAAPKSEPRAGRRTRSRAASEAKASRAERNATRPAAVSAPAPKPAAPASDFEP